MNISEKSKRTYLFLGLLFSTTLIIAQEVVTAPVASPVAPASAPIYEQLGVSSTTLFTVMTIFTFLLLAFMMSMANSTKNILKYKQDLSKKNNTPKVLLALVGLFASSQAIAAPTVAGESLIPFSDTVFWTYIAVDIVLIMFIIYFAGIVKGSISDVIVLRKMFRWKKLGKTLTNYVPIEEEASILLDHDYDGIKELDNQLPPWWKYGFYITIVWAFVYFFYYQVLEIGPLQQAEYELEMEEGERQMAEYKSLHPEMITAETAELLTDAATLSAGREVFETYCISCHMEKGMGGVGPNLTDPFWMYGSDITSVFTTISEGKPQNGMAAWKNLLAADKIQAVSSYVLQLDYIAPPIGKEPQGTEE